MESFVPVAFFSCVIRTCLACRTFHFSLRLPFYGSFYVPANESRKPQLGRAPDYLSAMLLSNDACTTFGITFKRHRTQMLLKRAEAFFYGMLDFLRGLLAMNSLHLGAPAMRACLRWQCRSRVLPSAKSGYDYLLSPACACSSSFASSSPSVFGNLIWNPRLGRF